MAIVVVSRWKGPSDLSLARGAAPLFKKHGAITAYVGTCYSGQNAGQHEVALVYPDWEIYGNGMQTMAADPDYQRLLADAIAGFDLQDRRIIVSDQIL
jgi:hypothetical protein